MHPAARSVAPTMPPRPHAKPHRGDGIDRGRQHAPSPTTVTAKLKVPRVAAPTAQHLPTAIAAHPAIASADRAWKAWAARPGRLERTLEVALDKPHGSISSEAQMLAALNEAVTTLGIGGNGPKSLKAAVIKMQDGLVDARGRRLVRDGKIGDTTAAAIAVKRADDDEAQRRRAQTTHSSITEPVPAPTPPPVPQAPPPPAAAAPPAPPPPPPAEAAAPTPPALAPPPPAVTAAPAPPAPAPALAPPPHVTPLSAAPTPSSDAPRTFASDQTRDLVAKLNGSPDEATAANIALIHAWDKAFMNEPQAKMAVDLARDLNADEIARLPSFIRDSVRDHVLAQRFLDGFAHDPQTAAAALQAYYDSNPPEAERVRNSKALHGLLTFDHDHVLAPELRDRIDTDFWKPDPPRPTAAAQPLSADAQTALAPAIAAIKADAAAYENWTLAPSSDGGKLLEAHEATRAALQPLITATRSASDFANLMRTLSTQADLTTPLSTPLPTGAPRSSQRKDPRVMDAIANAWYEAYGHEALQHDFIALRELASDPVLSQQAHALWYNVPR